MKSKSGFDLNSEKIYRNNEVLLGINQIRVALIVFSILYAVFGIADYYLVGEYATIFLLIRFCIVIPILIITLLITYTKLFALFSQKIMLLNFIVAGAGISYMLIILPNNIIYYGGMFMIYFSGYLLLKLRFLYSTIGGWINLGLYVVVFIVYNQSISDVLIYSTMFFIGANLIGMFGSYNIEASSRKNFLSNLKIIENNSILKNQLDNKKEEINAINIEIVFALAQLAETRDSCTGIHLENVGEYAGIITDGLPEIEFVREYASKQNYKEIIKVASKLHDIGKVGISDTILSKPGKLTESEFSIMKNHSIIGSEILEKLQNVYSYNEFINMGVLVTRNHHERFDGLGYPDGLIGKAIPLCARIVAICDTYDALTSKRPYKDAFSHIIAVGIIKNERGKQFDPELVNIFLDRQEEFRILKGD
jgi:HD-GYP domain-containing protein (c-di-GMP phosphodiesterase class II)